MKRYLARVIRPRFQVAFIDVVVEDDVNPDAAGEIALRMATSNFTAWKLRPWDPSQYQAHVEMILSDEDFDPEICTVEEGRDWMMGPDSFEFDRYLLLHANSGHHQGQVLTQPWVAKADPVIKHIARAWREGLKTLVQQVGRKSPHSEVSAPKIEI